MNDLITERTPLVIAAEIKTIKYQTEKTLLNGAVEIGRRLAEAKSLVPHGEWGKWLEESVNYSQSTANRLMQLFKEYGPKLLPSLAGDDNSNYATLHNLTYSQALILLGVPEDEREQFLADNDVENMTTLELRQAVMDKDQALQDKNKALKDIEDLQKKLDLKNSEITRLTNQTEILGNQAEDYKQKYQAEQDKVTSNLRGLEEAKAEIPPISMIAKLENDLKTAEAKAAVLKYEVQFNIHRDNMVKAFEALLSTLSALAKTDPKAKEKNRGAAHETVQNLANMLIEWPPSIKTNMKLNTTK